VHCLCRTPSDLANPLQFLGGEVRLLLVTGAFLVPQPRFLRDAVELRFWHAEQQGSSCLREVFWDLIVHYLPLRRRVRLNVSASSVVVVIKGALSPKAATALVPT